MGKYIDISNQRFGSLVALKPTKKNNRFAWHCICDCGNEIDIDSGNLRNGRTQSCGCQKNKKDKKKNLIGQKFNKLTVINKTDQRISGAIVWECQCDCGNICYIPTGNLKSGHTKSCGCLLKENGKTLEILNQKFGKLTVIKQLESENYESKWLCQCECGNETIATGWHLTKGIKMSCGCLRSKGEAKIIALLKENNILFETQKSFPDYLSPNGGKLYFDFYINNEYLIEYDGEQHFISKDSGWSNNEQLQKTQLYDEIKNQWCKEHNIPLIRIPYTKYETLSFQDLLLQERAYNGQRTNG